MEKINFKTIIPYSCYLGCKNVSFSQVQAFQTPLFAKNVHLL